MPPTIETYTATAELIALEADDGEGNPTIEMMVIPYGEEIRHGGRRHQYDRVDIDPDRPATLTTEHFASTLNTIGIIKAHEQRSGGLWAKFSVVTDTQAGREAYALAKAGVVGEVSGEIQIHNEAVDESDEGDPLSTLSGTLLSVALTPRGAFGKSATPSKVLAVNQEEGQVPPTVETPPTEETPEVVALTEERVVELFDESSIAGEVAALRQLIEDGATNRDESGQIEAYEWFAAQVTSELGNNAPLEALIESYALAASIGTTGGSGDASGLMPQGWWAAGLVNVTGGWRPLFSRLGVMPFPTTGTSIGYPKVVSGPDVDKRGLQDTDANTEALKVDAASAGIQWFDGALRVPLELLEQSDPAIMAVIWSRLVAKLNGKVEAHAADVVAKGGTAYGAVLTLTDYGTLVTDLVTVSEVIRQATDLPGNLLGCSTADWIEIVTMTDSSGRRVFSIDGPSNADGQGALTAQSIDIGGIQAFHVPDFAESAQFNTEAAKGSDKGPRRLQNLNVEKVGVEVGLLGAAIVAPTITAGIQYYAAALPT